MSNKEKAKELNVGFIGGEALTAEEEAQLRDYFGKKKSGRKPVKELRTSKAKSKKQVN